MACIYKLRRGDGLEYVGITTNLKKRLNSHKNSKRFSEYKISDVMILFEGTYAECDMLEESFIRKYDTFKAGLNLTDKGKGKANTTKFNTMGYKFSDESRLKMSISGKLRKNRRTGYRHSDEVKKNWSELRKGKAWGPIKIDKEKLLVEWKMYAPSIDEMCDLFFIDKNGIRRFKNNKIFNYTSGKLLLFQRIKHKEYNVTKEAIKSVIKNEYNI